MKHDPMKRFESQWREDAARPPATGAEEAARQVLARLDRHPASRRSPALLWAAAAVLVLLSGLGWWLGTTERALGGAPQVRATIARATVVQVAPPTAAAGHLATNVVLFWLDPETPLYMTLRPSQGDDR